MAASRYYAIVNWERYQHYSYRNPPWIKFYVDILDDDKLHELPLAAQLLWDRLLLVASRTLNVLPSSHETLAELTGIPARDVRSSIPLLLKGRWIRETKTKKRASKPASNPASEGASKPASGSRATRGAEQSRAEKETASRAEQNGSKTTPRAPGQTTALPDESISELHQLGAEIERRLGTAAPPHTLEGILALIPLEHRDENTSTTIDRAIEPLTLHQREVLHDEVLAAGPEIRNRGKYAVKIAQRLEREGSAR